MIGCQKDKVLDQQGNVRTHKARSAGEPNEREVSMIGTASHWIGRVSYVAHVVGSVSLAAMMFFVSTDVALRYLSNRPIFGGYEITQSLMGVLVVLALAYTGFQKGHITVDVVTSHLPQRMQAILESIMIFLCLFVVGLITWQNTIYIKIAFTENYQTASLHIPFCPLIAVISIGFALYWLVLLVTFLDSLMRAVRK